MYKQRKHHIAKHICVMVGIMLLSCADICQAQSPPVDLTELSLEELLGVRLISQDSIAPLADTDTHRNTKFGYRYLRTHFKDYADGTRNRTSEDLLSQFPVVPNLIEQEAHVLSLSQRLNPDLALQLEVPYIRQSTDHLRRNGAPFSIETEGIGDILGLAVYRVVKGASHQIFALAGLSLPTGSIDETGDTPRGSGTIVPYTMQIGSGTYDLQPGLLYTGTQGKLNWGGELMAKLRLNQNDRDYCLGDRATLSAWLKTRTLHWLEPHVKTALSQWERIGGSDNALDPTVAPVADPNLFGGTRMVVSFGADAFFAPGNGRPWVLGVEAGLPIYQSLNGPQPKQIWQMNVSITKGF